MTRLKSRFGEMAACSAQIGFETAQAILATHAAPLGKQQIPIAKAGRRRLAEPLRAQIDSPRCDTAAMDGYAIRSAEWQDGCRQFSVLGTSLAGGERRGAIPAGCAIRIMTGGPMPPGLDQVVVLEQVVLEGETIRVASLAAAKRHVRHTASDFATGDVLLPAGRVVDPQALAVAAAADVASLSVWRRPRVGCLASGDELAEPGSAQTSGSTVPDSLSQAILLLARQWGGKPETSTRVCDDRSAVASAARAQLDHCDVLVMLGGAAKGDRDFAKTGLEPLDLEIAFADVAIKPGKPVWYGRIGDRHVVGLPGNPTAAMTVARLFLAPLLAGLGGADPASALRYTSLPLVGAVPACPREQFLCATRDGSVARIVDRQSASMQSTLAHADLLVRIPPNIALAVGDCADTLRF